MHFWITLTGAYLIFWPMHYEGLAGVPRRYMDKSNWVSFNQFTDLNKMVTIISIIVFAALPFVFNFFYSIFKGRKLRTQNPWEQIRWNGPRLFVRHGNGKERSPKYIAGLMIMVRMEEISFHKPKRLERMNQSTN